VLDDILVSAEVETTLKKILLEIEKTKRRVNALEFLLIPTMEKSSAFIKLRLEEMERENVFRLKRVKK
jgi:V/A-type H+-transporting ATPase subunit D